MTGIGEILKERKEQLEKHGRTVIDDVTYNSDFQLIKAVKVLIEFKPTGANLPLSWDDKACYKMYNKDYRDRLIVAGALIAAEIDRIDCLTDLFFDIDAYEKG